MQASQSIKTIIAIVAILAISGSLYLIHTLTIFPKQHQSAKQIDTFMTNTAFQAFDKQGHLARKMHAIRLVHYPKSNTSHFWQPVIELIPDNGASWHITADEGSALDHNHKLMLEGHVIASQKSTPQQSGTTVKTSQLFYNTKSKIIYSPKPVTIIRDHSVTHAIGVRFNMKTSALTLLSHMHTVYTPETAQNIKN
jgi:LPS export ABC transporter protein LptC